MKTIVCVKQISHIYTPTGIDPISNSIDPESIVYIVNPYDEFAVEEAIRIKEGLREGEVVLIALGPPRAEKALRVCLAMGADKAIHLCDPAFERSDAFCTAMVLAEVIKRLEFDLVLCGCKSIDDEQGQVGAGLAEFLNLPLITSVVKLEIFHDRSLAMAQRRIEKGDREVIQCPLPAVFTIEKGINSPRYPTLPAYKRALDKEILRLDIKSLGISSDRVGLAGSLVKMVDFFPPKPKKRKIFTPDSKLSASERIKLILSGGIEEKKGKLLPGNPEEVTSSVIQFLVDRKII